MAKAKASAARTPKPAATRKMEPTTPDPIEPQKVHELSGLHGPYDTVKAPPSWPGSVTFWDCGISIHEIRRKHRALFPASDWLDSARFAKDSDSWKWRQ